MDKTQYLVAPKSILKIFLLPSDREYFSNPIQILPVPSSDGETRVHDPKRGHTYGVNPKELKYFYQLTRKQRDYITKQKEAR